MAILVTGGAGYIGYLLFQCTGCTALSCFRKDDWI